MENSNLFRTLPEGFRLGTEEDVSLIALTGAQAFADYGYPVPSVKVPYSALLKLNYRMSETVARNTLKYGAVLTNEDFSAILLAVPFARRADYGVEELCRILEENAGKDAADNLKQVFGYIEAAEKTLEIDDGTIYVEEFAVQTPRQGQKLGSKLMRELFRQCEEEGRDVFLFTNTERNRQIYHHFGFETVLAVHKEELNSDTFFLLKRAPE